MLERLRALVNGAGSEVGTTLARVGHSIGEAPLTHGVVDAVASTTPHVADFATAVVRPNAIRAVAGSGDAVLADLHSAAEGVRSMLRAISKPGGSVTDRIGSLQEGVAAAMKGARSAQTRLQSIAGDVPAIGSVVDGSARASITLQQARALDPTEFEQAVAAAFHARGYTDVTRVGGAGDLALDVIGRTPEGAPFAAQVKHYADGHKVTSPEIQTFVGGLKIAADEAGEPVRGFYVTTSTLTGAAQALAKKQGIDVVDASGFQRLFDLA